MRTKVLKRHGAPPLVEIDRDPGGFFIAFTCCALFGGACWAVIIGIVARLV